MNSLGLLRRDMYHILNAIHQFPEIERAVVFGSRAMGNFKKASDVDIAIEGEKVNHLTQTRLSGLLNEELPLPYFFDVIDFTHLKPSKLQEHIKHHGQIIFHK